MLEYQKSRLECRVESIDLMKMPTEVRDFKGLVQFFMALFASSEDFELKVDFEEVWDKHFQTITGNLLFAMFTFENRPILVKSIEDYLIRLSESSVLKGNMIFQQFLMCKEIYKTKVKVSVIKAFLLKLVQNCCRDKADIAFSSVNTAYVDIIHYINDNIIYPVEKETAGSLNSTATRRKPK